MLGLAYKALDGLGSLYPRLSASALRKRVCVPQWYRIGLQSVQIHSLASCKVGRENILPETAELPSVSLHHMRVEGLML